mmetsp:Transcript_127214/g.223932  ORF Transcript_127214/g.223932 Transcript_127214/m.223932 type:complete len:235 (+) Transcript_127214:69-773(+)
MTCNIKMWVLMLVAIFSQVSAGADKKQDVQGFMQRKDVKQNQEAKISQPSNENSMALQQKARFQKQPGEVNQRGSDAEFGSFMTRVALQLVFGLVYYMMIVKNYPPLIQSPTPAAKKLQDKDEISALCDVSVANCLCSLCCSGPRAAHTFYITGISDYWCSLLGMSCCPCLVLCVANSFTDLNEKLGGEQRNVIMSILCSCLCSCCVIAQDAESLDLITGVKTGFCGVSTRHDL